MGEFEVTVRSVGDRNSVVSLTIKADSYITAENFGVALGRNMAPPPEVLYNMEDRDPMDSDWFCEVTELTGLVK